jgi:hypothetical protein
LPAIFFREHPKAVRRCKLQRHGFRKDDIPIEQNDPSLELFLGLEVGIARRIERLDNGDLFDRQESFSESDDVSMIGLRGWVSVDVLPARYLKTAVTLDAKMLFGMRA